MFIFDTIRMPSSSLGSSQYILQLLVWVRHEWPKGIDSREKVYCRLSIPCPDRSASFIWCCNKSPNFRVMHGSPLLVVAILYIGIILFMIAPIISEKLFELKECISEWSLGTRSSAVKWQVMDVKIVVRFLNYLCSGGDKKHSRLLQTHEMATSIASGDKLLKTAFNHLRSIADYFNLRDNVVVRTYSWKRDILPICLVCNSSRAVIWRLSSRCFLYCTSTSGDPVLDLGITVAPICSSQERCKEIVKDLQTSDQLKGRTGPLYMLSVIYLACREENIPRSLKELVMYDRAITEKELSRAINRLKKKLPPRTQHTSATSADLMVCSVWLHWTAYGVLMCSW